MTGPGHRGRLGWETGSTCRSTHTVARDELVAHAERTTRRVSDSPGVSAPRPEGDAREASRPPGMPGVTLGGGQPALARVRLAGAFSGVTSSARNWPV
jgi:hypothetical protein